MSQLATAALAAAIAQVFLLKVVAMGILCFNACSHDNQAAAALVTANLDTV